MQPVFVEMNDRTVWAATFTARFNGGHMRRPHVAKIASVLYERVINGVAEAVLFEVVGASYIIKYKDNENKEVYYFCVNRRQNIPFKEQLKGYYPNGMFEMWKVEGQTV